MLQLNSINPFVFADAIRDLLENGNGKFCNVLTVVPANCAKTLLLKQLEIIFWAFTNSANNKYAWAGGDHTEVIVLQNIRWSSKLICWKDLLLLLEGENVKLSSPKKQFATDVYINKDIPIFATRKAKIEFIGKHNTRDDRETEMMDVRWKIFEFTHRTPQADRKIIIPYPRCFTEVVFLASWLISHI